MKVSRTTATIWTPCDEPDVELILISQDLSPIRLWFDAVSYTIYAQYTRRRTWAVLTLLATEVDNVGEAGSIQQLDGSQQPGDSRHRG